MGVVSALDEVAETSDLPIRSTVRPNWPARSRSMFTSSVGVVESEGDVDVAQVRDAFEGRDEQARFAERTGTREGLPEMLTLMGVGAPKFSTCETMSPASKEKCTPGYCSASFSGAARSSS